MTLPSNCLPADPAAISSDAMPGLGAVAGAAVAGTAPTGMPFSSVLSQAAAPATTLPVASQPTGTTAPSAPAAPQTEAPGAVASDSTPGGVYPGVYYPYSGGPRSGLPQRQVTPVSVATPGAGAQQTAVVSGEIETVSQQGECLVTATPQDKPKSSVLPKEPADNAAAPEALALAYQFIAGQWVQQPPAPTPATELSADGFPMGGEVAAGLGNQGVGIATTQDAESAKSKNASAPAASSPDETKTKTAARQAGLDLPSLTSRGSNPAPASTTETKSSPVPEKAAGEKRSSSESVSGAAKSGLFSSPAVHSPDAPAQSSKMPALQDLSSAPVRAEKFAAPGSAERTGAESGVIPPSSAKEKKSVAVGSKGVTDGAKGVGTSAANRELPMSYSAVNKTLAAELPAAGSSGFQADSRTDISSGAQTEETFAAQAPKLVEEIREIADRVSVIDRNSVEVRFDFGSRDHLSVRVEYRDGAVHTTFRTDSSQVRDAISHEWQAQSAANEQRPYRVSEPVFAPTTSDRQNSSTTGDGSSHQRAFEQPVAPAMPAYASSRSGGTTFSAAAPASRSARPETSHHLHALA